MKRGFISFFALKPEVSPDKDKDWSCSTASFGLGPSAWLGERLKSGGLDRGSVPERVLAFMAPMRGWANDGLSLRLARLDVPELAYVGIFLENVSRRATISLIGAVVPTCEGAS
mgnify:CR=1 FL=1